MDEKRRSYEERIRGKPVEEKIREAINTYVKSQVLQESSGNLLKSTKKEIKLLLERKGTLAIIKPSDKRSLSKALLKDFFRELGGKLSEGELAKLADKLVEEFIVEELERTIKNN